MARRGHFFMAPDNLTMPALFGQRIASPAIPAIGVAATGKAMDKVMDKVRAALGGPYEIELPCRLLLERSVIVPIELHVQAGRNRLHLHVMVHDVDRKC